jgi:DNA repair protein RadC
MTTPSFPPDDAPKDSSQATPVLPTRKRVKPTIRSFHCALHEAGASRLTDAELDTVTRALVILERKVITQRETFGSPAKAKAWVTLHYGLLDREVFGLIFLDSRHRFIAHQQLFTGDLSGASVHPRQVIRSVMEYNAAALICLHNHPSHNPEPSQADELITQRLRDALAICDCRLLDHFVIAGGNVVSFAERGLL